MNAMKKLLPLALLLGLVACGGSSPTAPPTPAPIPAANLGSDGAQGQWSLCAGPPFNVCNFSAGVRNSGPGCATNIRGVVRFLDGAGNQVGASVNWTAPAAVVILRPNESFTFVMAGVASSFMTSAQTFRTEANWDNVRC
jgi:hypothetical protein